MTCYNNLRSGFLARADSFLAQIPDSLRFPERNLRIVTRSRDPRHGMTSSTAPPCPNPHGSTPILSSTRSWTLGKVIEAMARPSSTTTDSTHEPLLRPTRSTPLKLHIHREGLNDRSIKAAHQKTVLYYIRSPYTLSSTSPLKAYRGRPDQAPHIVDMKPQDLGYTLEFPGPGPKVMIMPPSGGISCTKSKFVVNG